MTKRQWAAEYLDLFYTLHPRGEALRRISPKSLEIVQQFVENTPQERHFRNVLEARRMLAKRETPNKDAAVAPAEALGERGSDGGR